MSFIFDTPLFLAYYLSFPFHLQFCFPKPSLPPVHFRHYNVYERIPNGLSPKVVGIRVPYPSRKESRDNPSVYVRCWHLHFRLPRLESR